MSTDCVFSGKRGNYKESDQADPIDFYGLSKVVGEPSGQNVLVIRTSMVGPELEKRYGLLEWFLSQRDKTVPGFTNAVFSGFYTRALANLILDLLSKSSVVGLRHLSAEPLSKYDLLKRIRDTCRLPIEIVPDGSVHLDRSLDSTLIREECHLQIPSWDGMIELLAQDLRREGRV
jgi:dTDP-4-dehydrorhamnose reductase